ncbi:hypothetical protein MMMDOFMJ_2967 [Methylobacterium gnaphalii]|nr:hypothetical protein MMMDOFMJ_2967 [Methylobacterium gnaphalii]
MKLIPIAIVSTLLGSAAFAAEGVGAPSTSNS